MSCGGSEALPPLVIVPTNPIGDTAPQPEQQPAPHNLKRGDINRDGVPDLILRGSGGVGIHAMMLNDRIQASEILEISPSTPTTMVVVGVHDFDQDTYTDILLYHTVSGALQFLKLGGTTGRTVIAEVPLQKDGSTLAIPMDLRVFGVADLDGDGDVDLLLRNPSIDSPAIAYEMNGIMYKSTHNLDPQNVSQQYEIMAVSEGTVSAKADIFWQRTGLDQTVVRWKLNGFTKVAAESAPLVNHSTGANVQCANPWRIQTARRFPGDAEPSLMLENTTTGFILRWMIESNTWVGYEHIIMPILPMKMASD